MLTGCKKEPTKPSGPTKWTETQEAKMASALYDEVLPFAKGFGDLSVKLEDDPEEVINPTITVKSLSDKADASKLLKYSELFTEDEGWVADSKMMNKYKNFYKYEKAIPANNSSFRYVDVQFYASSKKGEYRSSGKGYFYLVATDMYVYNWPDGVVADFVNEFESDAVVPTPVGSRYTYDEEYGYVASYFASELADGGYSAILTGTEAGWEILEILDADGYYIANSPDKKFSLRYLYDSYYGCLDIYFDECAYPSWPQPLIDAVFEEYADYGAVKFSFPSMTTGGLYSAGEDPMNAFYIMFGYVDSINGYVEMTAIQNPEDVLAQYFLDLTADSWTYQPTVPEYEDEYHPNAVYYAITKSSEGFRYDLSLEFDASTAYAYLTFYLIPIELPSVTWPTDKINAEKPSVITDSIPEFNGENEGYIFDQNAVYVYVSETADTAALIASYKDLLKNETNGYTEETEGILISPNGQIRLQIYVTTDGVIAISITYL